MTRRRWRRNTARGSAHERDKKNGAYIDTATFATAAMQHWSLVSLRKRAGPGTSLGHLEGEKKDDPAPFTRSVDADLCSDTLGPRMPADRGEVLVGRNRTAVAVPMALFYDSRDRVQPYKWRRDVQRVRREAVGSASPRQRLFFPVHRANTSLLGLRNYP